MNNERNALWSDDPEGDFVYGLKIPIPTYSLYERSNDVIITEDYYSLLD